MNDYYHDIIRHIIFSTIDLKVTSHVKYNKLCIPRSHINFAFEINLIFAYH